MTTKAMYRYTKETLLAFASLPSCQSRPDGIDPVLWRNSINPDVVEGNIAIPVVPSARGLVRRDSELGCSKSPVDDIPEWRRPNGGGAILQSGPRRKPYEEEPLGNAFSSSYPPRPSGPWVEHNGPLRPPPHDRLGPNGPPGRWDRGGDRDRERGRLPHDWNADEGGPGGIGDAGQRPWVERDGLLGSGNRPPSQHSRMGRPADNYQPSRPLIKTPMYGRREDTDTVNDETFGYLESSNGERAEQERKRRESFELMRKEQHRQLQEKKQPLTKSENMTVNRKHDESSLWDSHPHQSPPLSPIGKTVVPPGPTTPRPAVPPGFSKVAQQRLNANKSLFQQEVDAQGAYYPNSKNASVKDQTLLDSDKAYDSSSAHSSSSIGDIKCATPIGKEMIVEFDIVETKVVVTEGTADIAVNGSLSSGGSLSGKRSAGVPDMWSFNLEGQDGDSVSDILSTEDAGSIRKESLLDKLFGNASPAIIDDVVLPTDLLKDEPLIAAPENDNWSGNISKTSKFAHWFHAEEDKFTTSQTSSAPNIMSLFGKSEHADDSASLKKDVQSSGGLGSIIKPGSSVVLPMPVGPSLEDIEKGFTAIGEAVDASNHTAPSNGSTGNSISMKIRPPTSPPVFMTCEDIEQTLLAEAAGSDTQLGSTRAPPVVENPPPKDDASASQHLLALLQKRLPILEAGLSSKAMDMEVAVPNTSSEWARKKPETSNNQATEVHTLEALFGKAFMSELQSSEALAPVSMFSDEGSTRLHKSELGMQTGDRDFNPKARPNGMGGPQDWLGSSGPGWNSMWPDSKDVEAGGYQNVGYSAKESPLNHPVSEDFEDRMTIAPHMPGLWGKTDATKVHNHVFMDTLNGAAPNFGSASLKQAHNEEMVKNNKPFPGPSMQHQVQQSQQRSPLGSSGNASFTLRPQAQGAGFNSNGLDLGFEGFPAHQQHHIQQSSHSPIAHPPPPHILGQPQILQRPQLYYGIVSRQEQEVIKPQLSGSVQASPGNHMHGLHLSNQVPPGGFLSPFQSEFQRTSNKSLVMGGYSGVGSVERWFGIDGRRSGLLGPSLFPQAPLGVDGGDMTLRYG